MRFFFLIIISLFLFLFSVNNTLIFDDTLLTVENATVTDGSFTDALTSYRPVRTLSYWLDYRVFGPAPWGFRLMNIVYHIIATLGVLALFGALGMSQRASFFGALLFAVHPIHCDAVTYISGRRNVLSGMFFIFSVLYFIRYYRFRHDPGSPVKRHMSLAVLFMLLSYFSKETGATIPLIWLLYVLFHDGKKVLETRWFYLLSLGLVAIVSTFALYTIQEGASSFISFESIRFHGENPVTHYLTAITLPIYYITQTVFPLLLRIDNIDYPLVTALSSLRLWFSVAGIVIYAVLIRTLLVKKHGPVDRQNITTSMHTRVAFFLVFFMITLLPMLQIIPLHEIVAEHYLYLPSLAFCGILGMLSARAWDRIFSHRTTAIPAPAHTIMLTLFFATLVFFSWRTVTRNMEMKNWWTLLHAEKQWGDLSYRGYYTLASEYYSLGFPDRAQELVEKSLDTGLYDENSYTNLLRHYFMTGQTDIVRKRFPDIRKEKQLGRATFMLDGATAFYLAGDCEAVHSILKETSPETNAHRREIQWLSICPQNPGKLLVEQCADTAQPFFCSARQLSAQSKLRAFLALQKHLERHPLDKTARRMKTTLLTNLGKLKVGAIPVYDTLLSEFSWDDSTRHTIMSKRAQLLMTMDIPAAIKAYRAIIDAFPNDRAAQKIITMLEQYEHDILVEKQYYQLDV